MLCIARHALASAVRIDSAFCPNNHQEVILDGPLEKLAVTYQNGHRLSAWSARHVTLTNDILRFRLTAGGEVREEIKLLEIDQLTTEVMFG